MANKYYYINISKKTRVVEQTTTTTTTPILTWKNGDGVTRRRAKTSTKSVCAMRNALHISNFEDTPRLEDDTQGHTSRSVGGNDIQDDNNKKNNYDDVDDARDTRGAEPHMTVVYCS